MSKYSKEDIIRMVREDDVEFSGCSLPIFSDS